LIGKKRHFLPGRSSGIHSFDLHYFMPTAINSSATPSQAEQLIRVSSAIASDLIKAHEAGQTVSLNEIRNKWSKKFNYGGVPRLVDIISAVPDEYKKALLPKLKARPIRTASGVSSRNYIVSGQAFRN
jgi:elongator complex protein 3